MVVKFVSMKLSNKSGSRTSIMVRVLLLLYHFSFIGAEVLLNGNL